MLSFLCVPTAADLPSSSPTLCTQAFINEALALHARLAAKLKAKGAPLPSAPSAGELGCCEPVAVAPRWSSGCSFVPRLLPDTLCLSTFAQA